MTEIRQVGVVGCGLMGSGIAQVVAGAGFETIVCDLSETAVAAGIAAIDHRLARLIEKEKITAADRESTLSRIRGTVDRHDLASTDFVIEAIVEDLEVKNRLWVELDAICPPHVIFATNTSSLAIAEMAAATNRPDRVIGLHFFNPVPVMQLVEVVRTPVTDPAVVTSALAFVEAIGKEPIESADSSGFVVNRLLVPYMMDAIRAVESGVGSIESIDRAMRLGAGHPMGPLTLCDFVGNDTLARIGDIMFGEYNEKRFAAPPLLKRMVALGLQGRKSGKGFYDYSKEPPAAVEVGGRDHRRRLISPS